MVALVAVEVERKLRILTFRKFPLVPVLADLHELCRVAVYRKIPAEILKEFHMDREGRQPFLASDNMSCTHQMIVNYMRKVIGRDTCLLYDDHVEEVVRH